MKERRAIDLIRAALEKRKLEIEFELPTDPPARVKMQAPDLMGIWAEQEIIYQRELARCKVEGMDKLQVNVESWEQDLQGLSAEARAAMLREAPRNLAEQLAQKLARYGTVWQVLPRCLRDAKTGEPLCKTPEEERDLKAFIASDPNVIALLTAKYAELATAVQHLEDEAKNFSKQGG